MSVVMEGSCLLEPILNGYRDNGIDTLFSFVCPWVERVIYEF